MRKPTLPLRAFLPVLLLATALEPASAQGGGWRPGMLRDRLTARRANAAVDVALPAGTRMVRDVAYGRDPRQRFDVYAPRDARGAPVIFMVHGGGWSRGDKAMANVVRAKVARWVPRGFIVISTNYRMVPDADPVEQARDVARAVAAAQRQAAAWGGDRTRLVLMGHSAGAHLVALLSSDPALAAAQGAAPWLGTVVLDGGTMDVVETMEHRHFPLFDNAFGRDPAFWRAASPLHALKAGGPPVLLVCSSRRSDSCPQARAFAGRAAALGRRAQVLPENLSHTQVNATLGEQGAYTTAVERFLASLDPTVASRLRP
ncbi:MAG TPA: alpha/beta hydrolase [Longimicrobiaceae bacterium]|nr:alpha/beta hydrolase [Longimicrobiaceae bacterium]